MLLFFLFLQLGFSQEKRKVLVDCDPGIDDGLALQYLLYLNSTVEIVAVTIVDGNTKTSQSAANALRLFKSHGVDPVPPIYLGADKNTSSDDWFGKDGFGDRQDLEPVIFKEDIEQGKHPEIRTDKSSAEAIVHFSREVGDLAILALGPLSNIASALEIDSKIPERVRELTIMGGNLYGTGNSPGQAAEYNFWFDYRAAEKVISSFLPKLTPKIVTMELAFSNPVPISFWENMKNEFLKEISKLDAERYFGEREKRCEFDSESGWPLCDLIAAVLWTEPEVAQESWEHAVGVEVEGKYSK
ncbi:Oidioi.mRNA.OKI2018_I69.PAR.g8936.t1.cds [Oikopleura dioica]|uniref:Oidioi.mRNA.OKI2018_I69.PAR.g8936.t1.cds n=1 Tax=Oikopleura dioica TaxID=34765 RepID=A0ABN7RI94_OIKDI|nr:Oidioi.mRNA.OKI2018_I69.PAR.g8936.t1.cds [Oikopleura dioica]